MNNIREWLGDHGTSLAVTIVFALVIGLIAGAVVITIANEANAIDAGIIIDKRCESGSTQFSANKYGGSYYRHPASYYFTIRGEKNGKTVEYSFEVTAKEYDAYKIGEVYHR
jgi:hypothetical protein